MSYSGSGDTTAAGRAVDLELGLGNASTSGCEAADFAGFTRRRIALIQRGTCTFGDKVANAEAGGRRAARSSSTRATPPARDRRTCSPARSASPVGIPAVGISYADGVDARAAGGPRPCTLVDRHARTTPRSTANVIAETRGGDPTKVVLVGSHLDSVPEGPGINDNGTGTAFNLELGDPDGEAGIAPPTRSASRCWGAEEEGLLGSTEYVDADLGRRVRARSC